VHTPPTAESRLTFVLVTPLRPLRLHLSDPYNAKIAKDSHKISQNGLAIASKGVYHGQNPQPGYFIQCSSRMPPLCSPMEVL
jgi:hypothetical protein